jgi:hypothetical protein
MTLRNAHPAANYMEGLFSTFHERIKARLAKDLAGYALSFVAIIIRI